MSYGEHYTVGGKPYGGGRSRSGSRPKSHSQNHKSASGSNHNNRNNQHSSKPHNQKSGYNHNNNNHNNNQHNYNKFNQNNRHQNTPKPRPQRPRPQRPTIDLNRCYEELKAYMNERADAERIQDRYWDEVHRGYNRKDELHNIARVIGENTNAINRIISKMCSCKSHHKAMNMAYNYIRHEEERTRQLIKSWQKNISDVQHGKCSWIDGSGHVHQDSTNAIKYVESKKDYLRKLYNWEEYVSRYLA